MVYLDGRLLILFCDMTENDPHRGYYQNTTENLRRRIIYQTAARELVHNVLTTAWGDGSIRQPNQEEGMQIAELTYRSIEGEDPIDRIEIIIPTAGNVIDNKGELQAVVELTQFVVGSDNDNTAPELQLIKRYDIYFNAGRYAVESQFYYYHDLSPMNDVSYENEDYIESEPIGVRFATIEDLNTLNTIISESR